MKIACIEGIAALARATTAPRPPPPISGETLTFGADYLIPKPFDPRLMGVVASAVARAAMETGVATRPLDDMAAYKQKLDGSVFRSALIMRPVFEAARHRHAPHRLCRGRGRACPARRQRDAGGDDRRPDPDRPPRRDRRPRRTRGPADPPGRDFEIVNPENDPRYRDYWDNLSRHHGAARRHPRHRPRDHAHQHHRHRRGHGAPGRGRQPDLRHLRAVPLAPATTSARSWPATGCTRSAHCR